MICEKCGFEYEGEKCPVCEVNDVNVVIEEPKRSPMGLISMIMGIASFFMGGVPLSIASIILGSLAKKKCSTDGYAKAGIICSIINIILCALIIVGIIAYYIIYIIVIFGLLAIGTVGSL